MAGAFALTWRPEQDDFARDSVLLHCSFQGESYCDAGDSDEIVATSVTDIWQRIHLGVDTDDSSFPSGKLCAPRCGKAEIVPRHGEALLLHEVA